MQLWKAKKISEDVAQLLSPYCHEIVVCGSVRRGKTEYNKDIDLVIHPIIETLERQPSLLPNTVGTHIATTNHLTEFLHSRQQIDVGIDVVSVGQVRHRLHHHEGNIDIELYCITDLPQRGVAILFRTGPAEFSTDIATFALNKHWHITGQQIHMHEKGGRPGDRKQCPKGSRCPLALDTPEERDVFRAFELPYIEPEAREGVILPQLGVLNV